MQKKSDPHIFSGMQRDMSISKQKSESLYDAKNLRFTARDGDTMLSITNERGTIHFPNFTMHGNYLGHCVVDDYIIVFTNSQEKDNGTENGHYVYIDRIYKIIPELPYGSTEQQFQELYKGNLNFSGYIETLGVYENDNIQKVYWTDGVNQPRYIVCSPYGINKIRQNDDTQFDFVPTLSLNETVDVVRKEGSGYFAPGTIQYAFTYYNKYGRQSNIFYTTLLYYVSYPDRAGSPEDKISVCFEITIDNLQTDEFDYLRVYSIHRTSESATPTAKRLVDIELATVKDNSTTFTDDGEIGSIIDPTELLYMGGETILAQTITQKDNTMFFGNLTLQRKAISQDLKDYLCIIDKSDLSEKPVADWGVTYEEYLESYNLKKYDSPNGYYNYVNSLNWSSPGFKLREHYRLGVQFQHTTGKWSEPIFIGDCTLDGIDIENNQIAPELSQQDNNYILKEPSIKITLKLDTLHTEDGVTKKWADWLLDDNYKKVRPVVVFPTISDRLVLTQGMLCPTVFNLKNRRTNTPFSQSSWLLRPFLPYNAVDTDNYKKNIGGNWAEFRHFRGLGTSQSFNCEVQGNTVTMLPSATRSYSEEQERKAFFVDQSILTMHSPDIDWDTRFHSLDYTNWKLRLVGIINFTSSVGDIDIQVSSPANKNSKGFIHDNYGVLNRSPYAANSLLAGPFWNDYVIASKMDDSTSMMEYSLSKAPVNYIVYPWHKSGSLNNDENRGDNGTSTAVLKQKKISNLKFSDYNTFFPSVYNYSISPIQLFDSEQLSVLKIPYDSTALGNIIYYGNIDTLMSSKSDSFKWMQNIDVSIRDSVNDSVLPALEDDEAEYINENAIPVRMKYKTSKHLVFSLKNTSNNSGIQILPTLNNLNARSGNLGELDWSSLFWTLSTINPDSATYGTFNQIKAVIEKVDDFDAIWQALAINDLIIKENSGGVLTLHKVVAINSSISHFVDITNESTVADGEPKKYWYNNNGNTTFYEGVIGQTNELQETAPSYNTQELEGYANILQDNINMVPEYPYLFLGELYREDTSDLNAFNGLSDDAIKSNLWIPAGKAVPITDRPEVKFTQGDTWYTRYDCLKTYPFTQEDENQIVEIGSFLCEARVNGDGRYDRNRGQVSNINMSPINFNLLNPVYNNHDNFFNYRVLDDDYYKLNSFSNQITWSKEKQNAADVDLWTNITMANTFDLDGTMGPINALRTWKDTIYCFQDNAISIISFNPRVQIPTSDGVPIEISNSYKLEGKVYISDSIGCKNKQTIAVTPSGVYFIDPNSKELYNLAGNQLTSVSGAHGFSNWFKSSAIDKVFYDKNRNDLYILNAMDCIVYSEILGQFTSFMDYNNASAMFNINDHFFAFRNKFVNMAIVPHKEEMFELGVGLYNDFFGTWQKDTNQEDVYVPEFKPYWLEFISNQDSALDKIYSTVDMRVDFTDCDYDNPGLTNDFFDVIQVSNEYQDTDPVSIFQTNKRPYARKKFRIWRVEIPRDKDDELERIRNTWSKIKFSKTTALENIKMELHDLSVQYFI